MSSPYQIVLPGREQAVLAAQARSRAGPGVTGCEPGSCSPRRLVRTTPDWFEHRLFKGPDTDINLHVFTAGATEIDRMLLFRDRLRANDADRDAYLQAKRDLAKRTWRHMQHYADAKTAIVEQIIARAARHP